MSSQGPCGDIRLVPMRKTAFFSSQKRQLNETKCFLLVTGVKFRVNWLRNVSGKS